jgi:putative addiction module component (TIGR02574 family)
MDEQTRSLFEAALALPEGQKVLLVERLLASLPADSGEPLDDETFAAELDRRYDEFRRDRSVAIPWSYVSHDE